VTIASYVQQTLQLISSGQRLKYSSSSNVDKPGGVKGQVENDDSCIHRYDLKPAQSLDNKLGL